MLNLNNISIHFIGIGGISMSAIAKYAHSCGAIVTGSDATESQIIAQLRELGIKIHIGHDLSLVTNCSICVYTGAISGTNIELLYCQNNNITLYKREEFLSMIINCYTNSIAVSGSHGKTTTTGLIYNALAKCNTDPTLFIGGTISGVGNFILSNSEYAVYEACEYKRSFLQFKPNVCVILNIEADHLDYYKDFDDVSLAFNQFADNTTPNGIVVASQQAAQYINLKNIVTYGLDKSCDVYANNITSTNGKYSFDIINNKRHIGRCQLSIVGFVNVYNALAAYCACSFYKLDSKKILRGLSEFCGVQRRFEAIECSFCTVIADYAHHPSEIIPLLSITKQMKYKRVIAVFQPHTYTRTKSMLTEFANSLSLADIVILVPVYAAREEPNGVTSDTLADKINEISSNKKMSAISADSLENAANMLRNIANKDDLVLIIGAGDIIDMCKLLK